MPADNSVRTPGAGETIHSDEYTHATLGSGKTQLLKLVDGTLDSSVAIAAGGGAEANALRTAPVVYSTATLSALNSEATSATAAAANTARRNLMLFNTDANPCYVKYGSAASATSFTVRLSTLSYWEMPTPIYTGIVTAIWPTAGTGALFVTELT